MRKPKKILLILWSQPVYSLQAHKSDTLLIKMGLFVYEVMSVTGVNISILSKENLSQVASKDDEMVQIIGELNVASNTLVQMTLRLKANLFGREGVTTAFPSTLLYLPIVKHTPKKSRNGSSL